MQDPLVLLEMREIKINVTMEDKANSSGWASFFKTVGNRRRFFIIIMLGSSSQWLGNGLVSYFLVPVCPLHRPQLTSRFSMKSASPKATSLRASTAAWPSGLGSPP
jgi:hypothetical protein